ncbi:MAG: glycine cleavage system aminomethyltransferase GcvT [Pseudomonadota bacterium]
MPLHTPLYSQHVDAGGKVVDFAGWALPINYGSQVDEHHLVRGDAGMFDVSHMAHTELTGADATAFLRHLLANDVAKLGHDGRALYTCMLNPDGGVIDDLIVYRFGDEAYRVISNAATRDTDLAWMQQQAARFAVTLSPIDGLAMLAVQGPNAVQKALAAMPQALAEDGASLERFQATANDSGFVGRTGYTGEDGFEIAVPAPAAADLWQALLDAGVKPAGLGARDSLRLEAGMALYGNDLDESVTPLESRLAWTVDWTDSAREFVGRDVLADQRAQGVSRQLVGLVLDGRGVLRSHQSLFDGEREIGQITSGGFSPTTGRSIALARLEHPCNKSLTVDMRGRQLPVTVVPYPFVKDGQSTLPSTEENAT